MAGTLRMGPDPASSVCDPFGRVHGADNVIVCDGSTFPTFSGVNPTLTIMSVSLRAATALAYGEEQARSGPHERNQGLTLGS
jgi:choline dehydrogenase-like flavoprotein